MNGTANPMNRYLVSMASLSAVDLVITGIFIVLSGHTSVVFEDIVANLVILGLLNTAIGAWLFRPIRDYLLDRRVPEAAMRRKRARFSGGKTRLMPWPRMAMVRPRACKAPWWAAVSMPRAPPLTTVTPR